MDLIHSYETKLRVENHAISTRRQQIVREIDWCKHIMQFMTVTDHWQKQLKVGLFLILPQFDLKRHVRMMDQVLNEPVREDLKRPYPQEQTLKGYLKNYQATLRQQVYSVHARVNMLQLDRNFFRVPGFRIRKSIEHEPV